MAVTRPSFWGTFPDIFCGAALPMTRRTRPCKTTFPFPPPPLQTEWNCIGFAAASTLQFVPLDIPIAYQSRVVPSVQERDEVGHSAQPDEGDDEGDQRLRMHRFSETFTGYSHQPWARGYAGRTVVSKRLCFLVFIGKLRTKNWRRISGSSDCPFATRRNLVIKCLTMQLAPFGVVRNGKTIET